MFGAAMKLAKPQLDVGLFARQMDPVKRFWSDTVGLSFDHMLKLGGGVQQHRFRMNGSVLKINHSRPVLAESKAQGIAGLRIASRRIRTPSYLHDPDGNRVARIADPEHG